MVTVYLYKAEAILVVYFTTQNSVNKDAMPLDSEHYTYLHCVPPNRTPHYAQCVAFIRLSVCSARSCKSLKVIDISNMITSS